MSELLDDTWHSRDFPTLRAAARIADQSMTGARMSEIRQETGLSSDDTFQSFRALEEAGLVEMRWTMGGDASRVFRISAEARQLVGLWPSPETAANRLIAALESIIENTDDPVQKTRVEKIRDGFAQAGTQVAVSVATAMITGRLPS